MARHPGTQGYDATADALAVQYESIPFERIHSAVLRLLPTGPSRVLDVGAGTGRDAAALAELGHDVVAVEPTPEMRAHGRRLHPSTRIEWVDDALPDLPLTTARPERFGLIMAIAVLMHLNDGERAAAMDRLAGLLLPSGLLVCRLRHGPVPEGRQMFDVSDDEMVGHAERLGLSVEHHGSQAGRFSQPDVSWSVFAFRGPGDRL